jgi:chemotaxis protein CheD
MPEIIDVPTASCTATAAPYSLSTIGIGSCIAICLYDAKMHRGALLHIMLPRAEGDNTNQFRYADTALNQAIADLASLGTPLSSVTAKIVGGAQMFAAFAARGSIGQRNIQEVRQLLHVLGVPLLAEVVGGNTGRSVLFNLVDGSVEITSQALSEALKI